MRTLGLALVGATCLSVGVANAAAPKVTTDIPPVHSLVARVMEGVGEPTLILPPGASPHGYAMRPSEAALLDNAEIVFWVGPRLEPWLDRAIDTLADDAITVALMDAPGTTLLEFREGATFERHHHGDEGDEHDHDHEAGHDEDGDHDHVADADHDEHDHDHDADHDEHDHDHDADHDDHDHDADHDEDEHEHEEAHEHDHHGVDPHIWLDPENAAAWLDQIAATLAEADPDNAATYLQNATAGKQELAALSAELTDELAAVEGKNFIVFHDAYHYFENRFGFEAAGAVSLSDATAPGPARVEEIRDTIRNLNAVCVFAEPQFEPTLVATLVEGTDAGRGTLDPLGVNIEPGAGLYPELLRNLAGNLVDCLVQQ